MSSPRRRRARDQGATRPRRDPSASLARRAYRRGIALLPAAGQVEVKRGLLAARQRLRAVAARGPRARAGRPIVAPAGDARVGVTLVVALGGGRVALERACADAAARAERGEPVVVASDEPGVDLARDRELVLELVPGEAAWRAATGGDGAAYRAFVTARLDDLADAWGAVRVRDGVHGPGPGAA